MFTFFQARALPAEGARQLSVFETSSAYYSVNITTGLTYRVKYRAANINGWSDWSPVGYIQTATIPGAPIAPTMISATGSQLVIRINPSLVNGGALITKYKLFKDGGSLSSNYELLAMFDADKIAPATFTIKTSEPAHKLTSGERYRFFTLATNDIGDSLPSEEVYFTVTSLP